MGRKSTTGGITPKGDRIQLDFQVAGKRYRPTLDLTPNKTNLQHALRRLEDIKRRIRNGTFSFAEEFPEYRFIDSIEGAANRPTFQQVGESFLASIKGDVEHATHVSYRKILNSFWYPRIGDKVLADIRYSTLTALIGEHPWVTRKTRNNNVSVGRRVFDFAVTDHIIKDSPAEKLKSLKIQREPPDPYALDEAEALIAGAREFYGEEDGNYFEFGFFVGCRPSEQIALRWADTGTVGGGTVRVDKARVMARDKQRTKTNTARDIELCDRAIACLARQRALTGLRGEHIFGPYHDLQVQWKRWVWLHKKLGIRRREPYQMRHTSVTWNLMIGKNLLWVAENHGHSVAVMLKTYAKWLKGSSDADVAKIRRAMGFGSSLALEA